MKVGGELIYLYVHHIPSVWNSVDTKDTFDTLPIHPPTFASMLA